MRKNVVNYLIWQISEKNFNQLRKTKRYGIINQINYNFVSVSPEFAVKEYVQRVAEVNPLGKSEK